MPLYPPPAMGPSMGASQQLSPRPPSPVEEANVRVNSSLQKCRVLCNQLENKLSSVTQLRASPKNPETAPPDRNGLLGTLDNHQRGADSLASRLRELIDSLVL